jgi:hypothetical protein
MRTLHGKAQPAGGFTTGFDYELSFLAAFPIAYATVWLGLMRPPKIPFGDPSYGIYPFHRGLVGG